MTLTFFERRGAREAHWGQAQKVCFIADTTRGLCIMALGEDVVGGDDKDIGEDSASKVSHFTDDLAQR
jgi:hypothetical protein